MSKGAKIVLFGCLSVVVIGFIATVVGTYVAGSWLKKKTETLGNLAGTEDSEYGKKIAELKKEYPFTPREDNVITEDQLMRFLAVRKDVYQVWKKHEAEFKQLANQPNPDFGIAFKGLEVLNEVRLRQANALATHRMGPDEYRHLAQVVYITWMAKGAKDVLKDKSVTETAEESLRKQIEELDKQIQDPNTNPTVKTQLEALRGQLQSQLDSLGKNEHLQELDKQLESIPQQNLDLFEKHRAEIEQYSMAGLEMIGL